MVEYGSGDCVVHSGIVENAPNVGTRCRKRLLRRPLSFPQWWEPRQGEEFRAETEGKWEQPGDAAGPETASRRGGTRAA